MSYTPMTMDEAEHALDILERELLPKAPPSPEGFGSDEEEPEGFQPIPSPISAFVHCDGAISIVIDGELGPSLSAPQAVQLAKSLLGLAGWSIKQ